MNPNLAQRGLLILAVPFVLLLAVLGLVVCLERETAEAQWWSVHTKDVVNQALQVQATIVDAQSGARGYVVTRDPAFLAPYSTAVNRWKDDLDRLAELVRDNDTQAARVAAIRAAAEVVIARLAEAVALTRAGDSAGASDAVRRGEAEQRVTELRAEVAAFLDVEHRHDGERGVAVSRARGRLYGVLIGGGVASALSTGTLALAFYRRVSRRFAVVVDNTRRLAAGAGLAPPLDGADEIARLDGAFRDMADELTRSADRLRDLYDHAPCGYHSVDPTGILVAINRTELRWLGYEATEVVGRMRFADVVGPSSLPTYLETFARVREAGAASDVEIELVRRDGTTFPVLLNSSAIRGLDGRYLQSRTTLTDLTERRRAEAATRLFSDVVRNIPIGLLIYQLDAAGDPPTLRVRSGNPGAYRLLGIPLDQAAGRPVTEVFPAILAEQVRRFSAVAASGRPDDLGEFRYGDSRVAERWWAVQAFPLPDRSVGIAFQNVSARRQAEDEVRRLNAELEGRVRERTAELEEANRELAHKNAENEMFVYSVSHDLRSPLVNLQGFSRELEKGCRQLDALLANDAVPPGVRDSAAALLEGKMAKALGFIQSAVLRLSGIIEALLRLSRAGRVEYRWEAVDVARVAAWVVGSMQATIGELGAEVTVGDLPPAWGDPTAVEQVFANLIGNALSYLDPARPGRIEIGTLPPATDGFRGYYVRDNGLGIPEAHRGKIFQVFQRAHPQAAKGEGIGLAIVSRIAERHRGRVWVDSEAGVGSTFYVTLPAAPGGGRPEDRLCRANN